MMGDEDGFLEAAYKYTSINDHSLGSGDPIRVKAGQRVLLRILNASATEQRRIALAGHTFRVVALDGNKLPCAARLAGTRTPDRLSERMRLSK